MAGFEDSVELARRMNPEYWGDSMGNGGGTFDPLDVPDTSTVSIQRKLEKGIGQINGNGAVGKFGEGTVFDPEDEEIPAGTIVAMSEESLSASPNSIPAKMEGFRDLPILSRPIVTVERDDETRSLELEGFNYTASLRWGIVAARNGKGRITHSVPARVVHRSNGSTRVSGLPKPRKGPIRIGTTDHFKSRSGSERLVRVNLLEVMAYGSA